MGKITPSILMADPHIGRKKASDFWHEIALDLAKDIVDFAHRKNIKRLYILGDFFDSRKSLNVKSINIAYKIASILKELETFIIVGNHDSFYNDNLDCTSLEILKDFHPNIHIIDNLKIIDDNILMCPWNKDFKDYPVDYVLGHFEINDMMFYSDRTVSKGISVSDFRKFKQVFSGHYHIPLEKDNVKYLGSPYQMDMGDVGSKRGYYWWKDDGSTKFIEFTTAPKHIIINSEQEFKESDIKGNIVKLIYTKDYGQFENNNILGKAQQLNPTQLFVDFSLISNNKDISQASHEELNILRNNKDVLFEFIEISDIPEYINKNTLKYMINNLLKSLKNNE